MAGTGVTWGVAGAIPGNTAASLGNNDFSRIYTLGQETAPNTFTIQVWIQDQHHQRRPDLRLR